MIYFSGGLYRFALLFLWIHLTLRTSFSHLTMPTSVEGKFFTFPFSFPIFSLIKLFSLLTSHLSSRIRLMVLEILISEGKKLIIIQIYLDIYIVSYLLYACLLVALVHALENNV